MKTDSYKLNRARILAYIFLDFLAVEGVEILVYRLIAGENRVALYSTGELISWSKTANRPSNLLGMNVSPATQVGSFIGPESFAKLLIRLRILHGNPHTFLNAA
jgi:hypothetical protein